MRQTDNLNLTLLDRSDNMNWEEGVNKNFEELDKLAGELEAERRRLQRFGSSILFGPSGTDKSSVDVVVTGAASIQTAVDTWQHENKTLIATVSGVDIQYDQSSSFFRCTIPYTRNSRLDEGQNQSPLYQNIGSMVYSGETLLGYIISDDRGYIHLDRRVANGVYNISIYRAKPLTLRFLPGVYDLGNRSIVNNYYYWGPNVNRPGLSRSVGVNKGLYDYISRGFSSSNTTLVKVDNPDRHPDYLAARLRLYGDISLIGDRVTLKSPDTGSAYQYEIQPVVSYIGARFCKVEGIEFVNGNSVSGGSGITTNRPAIFISSCYHTQIRDIGLEASFYLSPIGNIDRLQECIVSGVRIGCCGSPSRVINLEISNCLGTIFENFHLSSPDWYDEGNLHFTCCAYSILRGFTKRAYVSPPQIRLEYCNNFSLSELLGDHTVELSYCIGITLSGHGTYINARYSRYITYSGMVPKSITSTESAFITQSGTQSRMSYYTPVYVKSVEHLTTGTEVEGDEYYGRRNGYYIHLVNPTRNPDVGYHTYLYKRETTNHTQVAQTDDNIMRYTDLAKSDDSLIEGWIYTETDPGSVTNTWMYLSAQ